jgi:diguanylate cyclase (GGDEF)-like protein
MGAVSRTPQVLVVSAREHPAAVALEEHGYIVLRARAGAVALTKARQASPDALLLDGAALPDMAVLDLARKLHQAVVPAPDTPIFIIAPSPPTVPEHRAALRAGVTEFLLEPLDGDQLAAKLARHLLARDATAGAAVDPATGLYDVQGLARCARDLTRRAFNHRAPLACVVLAPEVADADPDDAAATQARVAKALKESGRRSDAFGRIGPNEFAIIAPGSDAQGAMTLAARLLQAVEGVTGEPGDPAPRVRLHAGYDAVPNARYAPLGPEDLLARAVRALRRARASGASIGTPPD